MTAYELAERLEDLQVEYTDDLIHEKCVNMLRQQADRIAELEKHWAETEKAWIKAYDSKSTQTLGSK